MYRMIRTIPAAVIRIALRPVVTGRHNVPAHGPVILPVNHLPFIDSVLIPLVPHRPVAFPAKAEYVEGPACAGG